MLANVALYYVIYGKGEYLFPFWVDIILIPGYMIGGGFAFVGGIGWIIFGQLIDFFIMYALVGSIAEFIVRTKDIVSKE